MYQATRESGNWSSKFVNLCVSSVSLCVATGKFTAILD